MSNPRRKRPAGTGNTPSLVENMQTLSDERLVMKAKAGQTEAFGELCDRHSAKLLRVVQRITVNYEDAEDAVQNSFLSAYLHLTEFDERARFSTWLTRIAINSALGLLRKRRGKFEASIDQPDSEGRAQTYFELRDSAPNPEQSYGQSEEREIVAQAISKLRPTIRKTIEVHQLNEHSLRETAQYLGISTTAAKARMFQARISLRRMPILKAVAGSTWASAG